MDSQAQNHNNDPVIQVMTESQIAEYLKNKAKGGRNFEKGDRFENRFAVSKIAEELKKYIETGVDSKIEAQSPGSFVDDLVVEELPNKKDHFQLKNADTLYWGNGAKGSLLFDFYHEDKRLQGTTFSLSLIVSSKARAESLEKNRPSLLPNQTQVKHFPDGNLLSLLREGCIADQLMSICKSDEARLDELLALGRVLLARWCDRDGQCTAADFVDNSVKRFLRSTQSSAAAAKQLRASVKTILDSISGFEYNVTRGFFQYKYKNTRQIFSFDVFDHRFETVQDWIQKEKPTAFTEEFEDMLMTWSEA